METHCFLKGKDKNKDQSYFLAQISQDQLDYSLFPLGDMKKDEVRTLAREIGLPVAEKKDSQGICFLGKVKVPQFLSEFIDDSPGEIITTTEKLVGYHRFAPLHLGTKKRNWEFHLTRISKILWLPERIRKIS